MNLLNIDWNDEEAIVLEIIKNDGLHWASDEPRLRQNEPSLRQNEPEDEELSWAVESAIKGIMYAEEKKLEEEEEEEEEEEDAPDRFEN